jgi:hypothetical protein
MVATAILLVLDIAVLLLLAIAKKRGKMVKTFGQGLGTRAGGGPSSWEGGQGAAESGV